METSEILKHGQAIAICNGPQAAIEEWVKKIAQATHTSLDWTYRAGYAYIYCLGDGGQQASAELQKPQPGGIYNVRIL